MADRFSIEGLLDEVLRSEQHAEQAIRRIGPRRKRPVREDRRSSPSSGEDLSTLALAAGSPAEAAAIIYSRIGAERAAHLAVQLGGLEEPASDGQEDDRDSLLSRMADILEGLAAEQGRLRRKVARYSRQRLADDRYAAMVEKLAKLEASLSQPRARVFERNKDGLITSYRDE